MVLSRRSYFVAFSLLGLVANGGIKSQNSLNLKGSEEDSVPAPVREPNFGGVVFFDPRRVRTAGTQDSQILNRTYAVQV